MKNKIILFIVITLLLAITEMATAQPPLPPENGHGNDKNQPGGAGAPVGSGVMILLTLSAAYGAKKVHNARKDKNEI